MTTTPRVYVACLASYNAGVLHGLWVDATDADTIQEGIKHVIATSPTEGAEEWAFHDYDGFGRINLSEHESPEDIATLAAFLEEHEDAGAAYVKHMGLVEFLSNPEGFQDAYLGTYSSVEDYAAQCLEESGELESIPERLRGYFDYEAYARDLELRGDISTEDGGEGVFIFSNH